VAGDCSPPAPWIWIQRDVDEADERSDRQINSAATGEGGRHQRVGGQNERHGDDDCAADAAGGDQARTAKDRDEQQ